MGILIQKESLGEELGVSLATVNNWIKTQVIPTPDMDSYYSKETFDFIINKVKNDPGRLASRANRSLQGKKETCYLGITDRRRKDILDNLVVDFEESNLTVDEGVLALAFAMLRSNNIIVKNWHANSCSKIDILLSEWLSKSAKPKLVENLYSKYDIPGPDDDILGAFYQSIQSVSQKSTTGSYYTPSELLNEITASPGKTILDPCCGSGGILLNVLTKKHDTSKIFARDIDETALKICFVNLVLFFNDKNIAVNISKQDIAMNNTDDLFSRQGEKYFDFIVTNPPWGSKYSRQQKDFLIASYPEIATTEIFSISLYNALKMLKNDGELFFFLPHAFLNVAAHRNIRNYVFTRKNEIEIKLLGSAFKGVLSESILIHIKKGNGQKSISIRNKKDTVYQLPRKKITPPDYIVSATSSTRDTLLMEKMYNTEHITLQDNTVFALGIVTGNNKKHLLCNKTENAEAIFRGKDMERYIFLTPGCFIEFRPELYQQIAPVEYYRQRKIAYRFISDRLICVLDNNNSLLLNSANFFVSGIYPMETITAFFNSDIYTFLFRKKFHSKKVLKSHLQNLPLPVLSAGTHKHIHALYNETFNKNRGEAPEFQAEIDKIICKSFSIDNDQYEYIKGAI
ncbi:MAG: N-6 DNA methylase [Treponema sp.]|jgi:tRNA1(Val) A37 N6-methylase TrmN6|nr:N-6 DNA methylase [Treponema sp.]